MVVIRDADILSIVWNHLGLEQDFVIPLSATGSSMYRDWSFPFRNTDRRNWFHLTSYVRLLYWSFGMVPTFPEKYNNKI